MSSTQIMYELKTDWEANQDKATAKFEYCGTGEFFKIEIDKASCEIIILEGGDSEGNCKK